MSKSISVQKPRKDFPLFPHQTGRWCKKVRQKLHYFGSTLTDPCHDGLRSREERMSFPCAGGCHYGFTQSVTPHALRERFGHVP